MSTAASVSDAFSLRGTLSFAALGLLGYALQIANGSLAPSAFWLTAASLVVTCAAFAFPDREVPHSLRLFPLLLAAGLLVHTVSLHLFSPAGMFLRGGVEPYAEHHMLFAAVATLFGVLLAGKRSAQHWAMALLVAL